MSRSRPRCSSARESEKPPPSRSMEGPWRGRAAEAPPSERATSGPGATSGTAERRPALALTTLCSPSSTPRKSGDRSRSRESRSCRSSEVPRVGREHSGVPHRRERKELQVSHPHARREKRGSTRACRRAWGVTQTATCVRCWSPERRGCSGPPPRPGPAPPGGARWAGGGGAFRRRRTKGLRLVVLRPALPYGPRQRRGLAVVLAIASLAARAGRSLWVPRRGPVVHTVHAHDVAQAALLVAEQAIALDRRAFNVAHAAPLPLEELARAVLQAAGAREAGRLPYSPRPARPGLSLAQHLPPSALVPPLYPPPPPPRRPPRRDAP